MQVMRAITASSNIPRKILAVTKVRDPTNTIGAAIESTSSRSMVTCFMIIYREKQLKTTIPNFPRKMKMLARKFAN